MQKNNSNTPVSNSFEISIKPFTLNKKYFVFRNKKFPINFNLFKINSLFFFKNQNQYENIELIDLFQDDEVEKFKDIPDSAITNFISLCQNETCRIDNSDLFYIEYLANKFQITALINIINNIIYSVKNIMIIKIIVFLKKSC